MHGIKKLEKKVSNNQHALDSFMQGYNDVARGQYLARATFVCYWETYVSDSLARLAPAMTQASLIHLLHRFIEMDKQEEAQVCQMMIANFTRLLSKLGDTDEEE